MSHNAGIIKKDKDYFNDFFANICGFLIFVFSNQLCSKF